MAASDQDPLVSHAHLNRLIGGITKLLDDGYSDELAERWRQLDELVGKHMREEEQTILPAYAAHDPEDGERLHAEHERMRSLFAAGSKAIELKRIPVAAMRQALELYRTHQLHEETGLYRWSRERRHGRG